VRGVKQWGCAGAGVEERGCAGAGGLGKNTAWKDVHEGRSGRLIRQLSQLSGDQGEESPGEDRHPARDVSEKPAGATPHVVW
jgi:hypothetical protein